MHPQANGEAVCAASHAPTVFDLPPFTTALLAGTHALTVEMASPRSVDVFQPHDIPSSRTPSSPRSH